MKIPLAIAHRGFSGTYPENTLLAFQKAMKLKPDAMECDVHFAADGKIMVIHDGNLERTTNGTGKIAETSSKVIRRYDAGSWKDSRFRGEKVPFLEELLDLTKGKTNLCIEMKAPEIAPKTIELIRQFEMEEQVILFSFDTENIFTAKIIAPDITTLQLSWSDPHRPDTLDYIKLSREILIAHANWLGINNEVMTPEFAHWLHQRGIMVGCYTVNKPERMHELIEMDVDAIISDYPDQLLSLLNSKQ